MTISRKLVLLIVVLVLLGAFSAAADDGPGNMLSVETGYGFIVTDTELLPAAPHALLTTLYYGYIIHDKPKSRSVLSLVLGYNFFPDAVGTDALHAMDYGLEYGHYFFTHKKISLLVNYGLQFNLILQGGRTGYSFGHHTKLGLGGVWNLSEKHKLSLNAAYHFVTSPYFELSSRKFTYPSASMRYHFVF